MSLFETDSGGAKDASNRSSHLQTVPSHTAPVGSGALLQHLSDRNAEDYRRLCVIAGKLRKEPLLMQQVCDRIEKLMQAETRLARERQGYCDRSCR